MKIFIAADHAGFELKKALVPFLRELGFEVEDLGAHIYNKDDDYPDFVAPLARRISEDPNNAKGIVIGGSGQGEAIAANRFRGVRAVVFNGQYAPPDGRSVPHEITISREHNDSNVLSLGARFLNESEAKDAVKTWLETPFSGKERHKRRLRKIEKLSLS
jgi:ribose 5-phosphate isomerase B